MRFCYHGIPASVCAGPCVPSSPPLPGALCFGGVLLPPSFLVRPHAPVSCPPANFPLTVISPASRARDLTYFASQTLRRAAAPLRRRAPRGHLPDSSHPRRSCTSPKRHRLGALDFPQTAFSRGNLATLQRSHYVTARSLARPPGQSRLTTARTLSSELPPRWSPNPGVRFATRLSGFYRGRSFPGWPEMVVGCTSSTPSARPRPEAPVLQESPQLNCGFR
jgi:hypothetical protein